MAKFIKSAYSNLDWINDDVTEVAFIGRSNVGKSSLINSLSNQTIARVSKTPGRTQLANFYDFGSFRIVDLPGYGYAKVSKSKKVDLINIIDHVLTTRKNIFAIYQIIDANVITNEDVAMNKYLNKRFAHVYVVLNKADKRPMKFYLSQQDKICKYLHVDKSQSIFISNHKKINIDKLLKNIKNTISIVS